MRRTEGAQQAYLEVRASNHAAIALYTRLGFRVCGRRPNYYRDPEEDAVLVLVLHNERNDLIIFIDLYLAGALHCASFESLCNTPFTIRIAQEANHADLDSGDTRATSDI